MDQPEGILIEEKEIKDLKDRKRLEELGYKIIKEKSDENIIKIFDEDKTVLLCDRNETIFRVKLLNSTLCRIMITDKLTSIIIFSTKRIRTFSFKIQRSTSIKGLRETYSRSNSYLDFIEKYINFLKENNDEKVIEWLKYFMKEKDGRKEEEEK
ncbi:hypothetical protein SJAV_03180 [Sulfurisphaera javensis]|uniref:Uncharacterized protein n=1 Tax=Sulfurisphaera javensis TaxID=2049879 RepID=A0AAT9GNL5_9CREN